MHNCAKAVDLSQELTDWFHCPMGQTLQRLEGDRLADVLSKLYGPVAVQIGRYGDADFLQASLAATRIVLEYPSWGGGHNEVGVRAQPDALPFDTKSIHVAVLPHTLDFADDPHGVLREVDRVLMPEGHVVIIGFNPLSLWGIRKWMRLPVVGRRQQVPWCGQFLRLARIKDWLALLDFETIAGNMLYYRPPVGNAVLYEKLRFLEPAGDRWWPMLAAVYILVAKKRELGMTPIRPEWKTKNAVVRPLAEPVARGVRHAQG
ncbi:MAG: class I SAM-dependent methyltransferase [Gammaproteobacteria bacterium]|nr:class I SAM-dependent methyltransferase [Gammaproteobacteria bacterium]